MYWFNRLYHLVLFLIASALSKIGLISDEDIKRVKESTLAHENNDLQACGHKRQYEASWGDAESSHCSLCMVVRLHEQNKTLEDALRHVLEVTELPDRETYLSDFIKQALAAKETKPSIAPSDICHCQYPDFWQGHQYCRHCGKPATKEICSVTGRPWNECSCGNCERGISTKALAAKEPDTIL